MNYRIEQISDEFTKYILELRGKDEPFYPAIHHFTNPDKGGPHDHPWSFTTHILKGGYIERVYYVKEDGSYISEVFHRRPGTVHTFLSTHLHEIIHLPEGECWTLVIANEPERDWYFWEFDGNGKMVIKR